MQIGRGAVKSLEGMSAGHRLYSHADNKSPILKTISIFKSAATALALCLVFQAQAETLLGKVIHVQDGDSITVLDDTRTQHKIRLTGIDAPERRQAFGSVSKESLAEQVAGQSVAVEWDKVDRYGRKVGKVLLGGLDSNLVQVKRGLAWPGTTSSISGSSPLLTDRAMQRPRLRPERRSWACGGMQNQCHPGSSGTRGGNKRIIAYVCTHGRI